MALPLNKKVKELDDKYNIPDCIYWDNNEVVKWIEDIGYPQYKSCFETNSITGRHLIRLEAAVMPIMGIRDFDHIRDICGQLRKLLGLKAPIKNWTSAMSDPYIAYLEMKRRTGETATVTSFKAFIAKNRRWYQN